MGERLPDHLWGHIPNIAMTHRHHDFIVVDQAPLHRVVRHNQQLEIVHIMDVRKKYVSGLQIPMVVFTFMAKLDGGH